MDELEPEILAYYSAEWDEDARLRSGLNELELIRTQELIRRHLAGTRMTVADIGGGSGIHAEWLLQDGNEVTLIDPVPLHIEQANDRLGAAPGFRSMLGDARALPLDDHSVDAALLLGPLYHLTQRPDRITVFEEALRVTKPGGLVVAAAITRFASLFAGLEKGEIFVPEFHAIVEADVATGQHRNVEGRDYFTTAFFHHPDELIAEAIEAGLEDTTVFAVEGPVMSSAQNGRWWSNPEKREVLLGLIRLVETEPTLMGIGPHILLIARAPGHARLGEPPGETGTT